MHASPPPQGDGRFEVCHSNQYSAAARASAVPIAVRVLAYVSAVETRRRAHRPRAGRPADDSPPYLEEWLQATIRPQAADTYVAYEVQVRKHFVPHIGTSVSQRPPCKAHLSRLGLRDQRFEDARHACASCLHWQGVPLEVVGAILGHSRLNVTADGDTHLSPSTLKETMRHMDSGYQFLGG